MPSNKCLSNMEQKENIMRVRVIDNISFNLAFYCKLLNISNSLMRTQTIASRFKFPFNKILAGSLNYTVNNLELPL